jgi:methionyl-tRNA formyltransferase
VTRTVFFGTPAWAVASLEALLAADVEVAAVVTNPDRPAGRGYEVQASPVKIAALEHSLDILQPEKARDPGFMSALTELAPDVCIVVAYGKILPLAVLEAAPKGFLNVHFSLLPLYRGAAPVQRAVMEGRQETGVSIMRLTEGMDEGPVLSRRAETIRPDDTAGSVGDRLAIAGAALLTETLARYMEGSLEPEEQRHEDATYASKITTEEARIDWTEPARTIHDKIRGLQPFPGAWTTFAGQRLKVQRSSVPGGGVLSPGSMSVSAGALLVGTGEGDLVLEEVQLAGKRRMPGIEAARGLRLEGGEVLGG